MKKRNAGIVGWLLVVDKILGGNLRVWLLRDGAGQESWSLDEDSEANFAELGSSDEQLNFQLHMKAQKLEAVKAQRTGRWESF